MNRIQKKLKEPFEYHVRKSQAVLISCLIVFLILYIFRPFGLYNITSDSKALLYISGFVVASGLMTTIHVYLLPRLFPRFFYPEELTVGRQILSNCILLSLIVVGVFICGIIEGMWGFNLMVFFFVFIRVILVAIFPIIAITFLNQNKNLRAHIADADHINEAISAKQAEGPEFKIEDFTVDPDQLLFIASEGNYVTVKYLDNDVVKQNTIRTTLKTIPQHDSIIRCHRAYIVNLDKVIHVTGNSQGYRLKLEGIKEEIPVSRAYTSVVKSRF